jgi:uncharacterized delta-60 repeat protein
MNKLFCNKEFNRFVLLIVIIFLCINALISAEALMATNTTEKLELSNLAALTGSERIDSNFVPAIGFSGRILTAARQDDGKLIVGGVIDNANGVPHSHLARILENGELDNSFIPPLINEGVTKVAVQPDGKILILGAFSQINGITRNKIARLNPNGTLDLSFNAAFTANAGIGTLLTLPSGDILVGGGIITLSGVTRNGLMRLNKDGTVDPSFSIQLNGFNTGIGSIALTSDNKLYIAGSFSQINGINRYNIAKIELDGTVIQAFDAHISNGSILHLIPLNEGKILIA